MGVNVDGDRCKKSGGAYGLFAGLRRPSLHGCVSNSGDRTCQSAATPIRDWLCVGLAVADRILSTLTHRPGLVRASQACGTGTRLGLDECEVDTVSAELRFVPAAPWECAGLQIALRISRKVFQEIARLHACTYGYLRKYCSVVCWIEILGLATCQQRNPLSLVS